MGELVSPKQAARAMGVSEASCTRWCDRGLLSAVRTPGGHRRLAVAEVLRFVRERGRELVDAELLGLPATTTGAKSLPLSRARETLREALVSGRESVCRQVILDLHLAGHRISTICDSVISETFHDIGDAWSCGEADVYQERRSCEICLRVLHELERLVPTPGRMAPVAIGGTLTGDNYQLPTTMASVVLRESGWNATSLGCNLPAANIRNAIVETQPALVWISVSHVFDEALLLRETQEVYETAIAQRSGLAIGGRALTPELRSQISCGACCDTMQHLESFAATLHLASTREPESGQ